MPLSDVGDVLERYTGASPTNVPPSVHDDFQKVAQNAPPEHLAPALSEAFRSDQTPSFGTMIGNLFGQSNGQQRAGILNRLLGSLGPGALSSGGLSGILGGLSGSLASRGGTVSPEDASKIHPDTVKEIAEHAE